MPVAKICPECQKLYFISPSEAKKYTFCSMNCRKSYNQKNRRVEKVCRNCGLTFSIPKCYAETRFCCSLKCKYEFASKHDLTGITRFATKKGDDNIAKKPEVRRKISESMRGRKNPNWKPPVKINCAWCDTEIQRQPSQIRKQNFCSLECLYKWHSERMKKENPMKHRDVAKRMSETLRNKYKDPKFKTRVLQSRNRHPNDYEKRFIIFLQKYDFPFEFVGNWGFWIGPCKSGKCRNPDFIHKNHSIKKAILIGAKYHHPDIDEELEDYHLKGWKVINVCNKISKVTKKKC